MSKKERLAEVLRGKAKPYPAAAAKSRQLCLTLCDPIDGSPPGSPVPGILQARTLEWVAIAFSNVWKWKVKVKLLSRVRLLVTPWTAAYQAPPSMGFSRQEYWSESPVPSLIHTLNWSLFTWGLILSLPWRWLLPPGNDAILASQLWPLFLTAQVLRSGGSQVRFIEDKTMLCNLFGSSPRVADWHAKNGLSFLPDYWEPSLSWMSLADMDLGH